MPTGTWVDADNVNMAMLESELMDHWSMVGVPYTRFTPEAVTRTVRAVITGIARQGGRFVRVGDVALDAAAFAPDVAELVAHVIGSRAVQPRALTPGEELTYARGDVQTVWGALACQDVVVVR